MEKKILKNIMKYNYQIYKYQSKKLIINPYKNLKKITKNKTFQ